MNKASEQYWQDFSKNLDEANPHVDAWQFGAAPDELAQLVVDGIKTATCSAYILYEKENEPLPKVGAYSIILDSQDSPVAIIQLRDVSVMPMNEVPESFAYAEGEGDRSYQYWWAAHEAFFTAELKNYGLIFSPEMKVVCERFEIVDVKGNV